MSERAMERDCDDSRRTTRMLLTTRQAAERLGVHERTVRRAIARGEIPARKQGGGYRIAAEALERGAPPRPVPRLISLPPPGEDSTPLPRPLTPFVGRTDDIAVVTGLLRDRAIRLVTLTGPGGIGKTRLAIAAAGAFAADAPDGVVFVNLAPIAREELVLSAIAAALGLKESTQPDLRRRVRAFLRSRRLLLLLDNCEHLPGAAPRIAELLSDAPALKTLLTSRAPLHISGECEFPVPALSLPAGDVSVTAATVMASGAGRLFVERARAADPGFTLDDRTAPSVAQVCARLDGLPLAIELAAAQAKLLPLPAMLARLEPRLPLLIGGARDAPARLRTMRNAIAWSYDLLSSDEQTLFRRLAVFVGGFTLAAAEWVGGRKTEVGSERRIPPISDFRPPTSVFDLVRSLLDQSLLMREAGPDGEPRLRMLETIREYGLERLDPDEAEAARAAHARCFLAFAQALRPLANTQATSAVFEMLAADDANLHEALTWLDERGPATDFVAMVAACCVYWYAVGHLREAEIWMAHALAKQDQASASDRARLAIGQAEQLMVRGDYTAAETTFAAGLPLTRAAGDPFDTAMALFTYGVCLTYAGKSEEGEALLTEALALAGTIPDPLLRAAVVRGALGNLSVVARSKGDLDLAAAHSEEALRHIAGLNLDLAEIRTLINLAEIALEQGNHRLAFERYLTVLDRIGERGEKRLVTGALAGIAIIATAWGQSRAALLVFGAVAALRERTGIGMLLPIDAALGNRNLAVLREALGAASADAILAEGRALSLAAAVGIAASVHAPADAPAIGDTPRVALTSREREVLHLIVSRHTDREIADALFLSLHTVHWHVRRILAKLGVASRRQAASLAEADHLV